MRRRAASFLLRSLSNIPNKTSSRNLPRRLFAFPFPECPSRFLQTFPSLLPADAAATVAGEDFGLGCMKVDDFLDSDASADHEKTLVIALRVLDILQTRGSDSVSVAKALRIAASASFKLGRFADSLESLATAEGILQGRSDLDAKTVACAVQRQLGEIKMAMGRRLDSLANFRKALELKMSFLEPGSKELGSDYKTLAEAYATVLDFVEALPMCLKALEVYKAHLGHDSVEVAEVRKVLGVIYSGLGEYEEALQQNELAWNVFESLGLDDDFLLAEIEMANVKIALGRLDDAVDALKGVIQQAAKESETQARVFVAMAKAMFCQEKFADARRCLEISCGILDKKEVESPLKVAEAYAEVSMLYEEMNEFETAMCMMKRALVILEKLPQERHLEGSIMARLGWLLLLTGRVAQAVPYLESAVDRLKESFGPKHFGLGFAYKHLGQAYLEMDQTQSSVKMLLLAKGIINACFGPHHEDFIDTCQCLANAYGAMGSYPLAMNYQQQVVEAWESHGPSYTDESREAHRLLEQLKKKVQGSQSAVFPANTLPLPPRK